MQWDFSWYTLKFYWCPGLPYRVDSSLDPVYPKSSALSIVAPYVGRWVPVRNKSDEFQWVNNLRDRTRGEQLAWIISKGLIVGKPNRTERSPKSRKTPTNTLSEAPTALRHCLNLFEYFLILFATLRFLSASIFHDYVCVCVCVCVCFCVGVGAIKISWLALFKSVGVYLTSIRDIQTLECVTLSQYVCVRFCVCVCVWPISVFMDDCLCLFLIPVQDRDHHVFSFNTICNQ